jgi:hypothetical protein
LWICLPSSMFFLGGVVLALGAMQFFIFLENLHCHVLIVYVFLFADFGANS